jgi:nonsense-mediated mRNA decay protein 3
MLNSICCLGYDPLFGAFPASRSVGDTVLGYDLAKANMVQMDFEAHVTKGGSVPDVLLVRKSYEERRRKHKSRGGGRAWKLKHLDIEMGEER